MSWPEPYNGDNCCVSYCLEQSFGVLPANPAFKITTAYEAQPIGDPRYLQVKTLGSPAWQRIIKQGMKHAGLRLSWFLPSSDPTGLLLNLMSQFDINGPNSLAFEVAYFFYEWSEPQNLVTLLFNGCKCDRLTVEVAATPNESEEALFRASADIVAQKVTVGTSKNGASYSSESGCIAWGENQHCYVRIGESTIVDTISRYKLDFSWNLKPVVTIRPTNGLLMKALYASKMNASATLEFYFQDKDRWSDLVSGAYSDYWYFNLGADGRMIVFEEPRVVEISNATKVDDLVYVTCKLLPKNAYLDTGD